MKAQDPIKEPNFSTVTGMVLKDPTLLAEKENSKQAVEFFKAWTDVKAFLKQKGQIPHGF